MQNAIYYKCTVYYLSTYMQGIIMYLVHADMPQMHCAYVYVHVLYIYVCMDCIRVFSDDE